MDAEVIKVLNKKEPRDEFHNSLLKFVQTLIRRSRSDMAKFYPDWDLQDNVFRGVAAPDNEDRMQQRKGKPTKMVVPSTYAQVMTFVSFLFLMFNQNKRFYELLATGDEDALQKKEDSELILERDLRKNEFHTKQFQFLLDVARFGLGILETSWIEEKMRAFIVPEPMTVATPDGSQAEVQPEGAWQEFLRYQGNQIKNVSPYRFFPDTRFPITDFQKGDFCAVEEEYSIASLRAMEQNGEVAGIEHIEKMGRDYVKSRGAETRWSLGTDEKAIDRFDANNESCIALVTKCVVKLIPSKFKFGPKLKPLGPETFPVPYDLWYANDNRVIKCEPVKNWHGEFPWSVGQFTPDMHEILNLGLADLIYKLQEVISWFINSHITSVRRVIANRLIVDPRVVDTKTLDGEGDIYLRKGVNMPLDRAVGQLKVQDTTQGHMGDADLLTKITEMVTGVNGNAMGQYNSGRRSAQESRVVTAGAAGRMKMHGHLLWETGFGRAGKQMHTNSRQSLGLESFARIVGKKFGIIDPVSDLAQRYLAYKGTPEEVICGDDFFIFDSTLASEKGFIAQSLQELLVAIMSNPVVAQQWDISAKALVEEIQRLRGAGNISQFSLSQRIKSGVETPPMPMALPNPEAQPPVGATA